MVSVASRIKFSIFKVKSERQHFLWFNQYLFDSDPQQREKDNSNLSSLFQSNKSIRESLPTKDYYELLVRRERLRGKRAGKGWRMIIGASIFSQQNMH